MNERIQELAEQCTEKFTTYSHSRGNVTETYFDKEKFAELIVRECANICFSQAEGHSMAFGEHCGIVIKEHFGVEE